ncbi:MAG TPA: HDIG domain-containing protein [Leptolyngbya sp.]|jgi:putative nucleotidyltransferase with HDIG domain|nr:HDIG domain-containing protein [Leptolyngbya sp.]
MKQIASKPVRSRLRNRFRQISALTIAVVLLTSGLGYRFYYQPRLDVDKVAPQTIVAPTSASIEDTDTTEENRRIARSGVLPAVQIDAAANQQMQRLLQQRLDRGNEIRNALGDFPFANTSILSTATQIYLRQASESEWQTVRQSIPSSAKRRLDQSQQRAVSELRIYQRSTSPAAFSRLVAILIEARRRYPVALSALAAQSSAAPLYNTSFLNLSNLEWQTLEIQMPQILARLLTQGIYPGLSEGQRNQAIVAQVKGTVPIAAQPLASQIFSQILSPNLVRDADQTKLLAEQAAQAIEPTLITIERGETIVRAGEKITQSDFVLLDYFNLSQRGIDWLGLLSFSGLIGGAIALFRLVIRWKKPKLRRRDYLLMLLLALSAPGVVAVSKSFTGLPAIGLLLGNFYGSAIGAAIMGLLTVLLPIGTEAGWRALMPSAVGGLFGSLMAGQWRVFKRETPRTREDLAGLGILIGLIQGITYLMVNTEIVPLWYTALGGALLSTFSGVAWSVMAIGISPYLERLFDLVTPIRLAELANPNRPLLKRLAHEAPGTFQHTQFVSTLAEAAARSLGCNVELVRAGTLHHDIGKLYDPLAFVENQMGGLNKHTEINDPWKSAEMIRKHVSEGLVMARQYQLPSAIQAFIPEHQGTILIAYFHHQARQTDKVVEESDFRYAGPIPQSRETGIVMLADACEAALRSLEDATPAEALATVNKVFKARWQDQQLVDSELTRQELAQISHIFVQVWQQFRHKRIAYPKSI